MIKILVNLICSSYKLENCAFIRINCKCIYFKISNQTGSVETVAYARNIWLTKIQFRFTVFIKSEITYFTFGEHSFMSLVEIEVFFCTFYWYLLLAVLQDECIRFSNNPILNSERNEMKPKVLLNQNQDT